MDTYIKVYDWMSPIPPAERLVYALIYQLTLAGSGFWSTTKNMSNRLGIPKSKCNQALEHLQQIGAVTLISQTILHRQRNTFFANEVFAQKLQNGD